MALAISTLLAFLPGGSRGLARLGGAFIALGVVLPIALQPLIDPLHARGHALWEWSAIGGPVIRASYELDPLAAVALALTVAFAGAALATAARAEGRHPALAALVLAIGLVTIAFVVTDDFVAATVVLAVLGALTVLALLAVAPPAATARAAAYLAIGLQGWVLAALLISRHGTAQFALGDMPPGAVTQGAVLAATLGALLFAGLYPVVAWDLEGRGTSDPGALGGLILMPVGIAATTLLLRTIANSGVAPTSILMLVAAFLTAGYASVVSLALTDRWETVRADLGLVALWAGLATGAPLAVAGGMLALFARAGAALAGALVVEPHREYIALVGGSAVFVAGALAVGVGAASAGDPLVVALALATVAVLVALELVQVGRHFRNARVPAGLDAASALAALLLAVLAAMLLVPLDATVRLVARGPGAIAAPPLVAIALAAAATVTLARTVRPLLRYFEVAAERSGPLMRALDPVPIAVGAFRGIEASATRGAGAFSLLEERAGVWAATLLIVALLIWAVR